MRLMFMFICLFIIIQADGTAPYVSPNHRYIYASHISVSTNISATWDPSIYSIPYSPTVLAATNRSAVLSINSVILSPLNKNM